MRNIILSLAWAAWLALMPPARGFAAEPDFSGKTITVLVGFTVGAAPDMFARLVAAHIGAHIPGSPAVIVQNMPGADGIVAANYLYNVAKRDGTVFLIEVAPFTNQYIGAHNVKFDTDKFYWLGALTFSNVIYVRSDLGIKTPADIIDFPKQIVIGGLAPNSGRDLYMKTFLEALGYKNYGYVLGYPGTVDIRNALLRDEVNFSTESAVTVVTDLAAYVREGSIIALAQSGLTRDGKTVRDPQLPDIPTAEESVVTLKGESARDALEFRGMDLVISMVAAGRAIFMPPGVDPAVGRALRKAVGELNSDLEFQNSAAKVNGGAKMELTDGQTAQKLAADISLLVKTDPAALEYLEDMSEEQKDR